MTHRREGQAPECACDLVRELREVAVRVLSSACELNKRRGSLRMCRIDITDESPHNFGSSKRVHHRLGPLIAKMDCHTCCGDWVRPRIFFVFGFVKERFLGNNKQLYFKC